MRGACMLGNWFHKKRMHIMLPLCVLICMSLWLLKALPRHVRVQAQDGGVWDLRGMDLDDVCAMIDAPPEYVPGALLTPEEFGLADTVCGIPPPDVQAATFRWRILLPEERMIAVACNTIGTASRIYVNGRLLGGAGLPALTKADTRSGFRYLSFTAWPRGGVLEIVEQAANYLSKDALSDSLTLIVGSQESISRWTGRVRAYPELMMGLYLSLFLVHLLLFFSLPSYRSNLWVALLCAAWALRTGVVGRKTLLDLWPGLTWAAAFRIEYLTMPATLLLLTLSYREMFPGALQKWFRLSVYGATALISAFYLTADTLVMSRLGVPFLALSGAAIVYALLRLVWKARRPHTEQKIIIGGFGALLLALTFDVLYYGEVITAHVPGAAMETAFLLFSMLQMTAMLHATLREAAAAREAERRLALENAALDRVNALKNELMSNLTHELRTPLTVMSTYAQLALRELRKVHASEQAEQDMDTIRKEAERLAAMASGYLDVFSRTASSGGHVPLAVEEILEQTVRIYRPVVDKRDSTLTLEVEGGLPQVMGDPDELTQVMFNLLSNANRHTQGGRITVSARVAPGGEGDVEIRIADTGEGIAPDMLPRIFRRNAAGKGGETGIGLALCKEIVEAHGGAISAQSRLGEGTSLRIVLPSCRTGGRPSS